MVKLKRNCLCLLEVYAMSSAMDRALMELSLEDDDEPFFMPDLPEYSSCQRNTFSLVGRVLNPYCQSMKHLIRNMPRKWQKVGRVQGVALSQERFQFIFNSEHDLQEVLDKGVHTFNEWTLAVDRWYENPPDDYLRFIPIWVQIWNLPVNHYTVQAITALGELIGQVKEVAFNPDEPQLQGFVRVKVMFDVSRPLRRYKDVFMKNGEKTTVTFQYEKIQKRCYECQRLTHERDVCPILIRKRQELDIARRNGEIAQKPMVAPVLKETDPLFGVLKESQVGIDPNSGRPRIAPVVLEGMRQYLRVSSEEEKLIRMDRVKQSIKEVEKDPLAQKSILRLELPPVVHLDPNIDKGIVFGYESMDLSSKSAGMSQRDLQCSALATLDVSAKGCADRSWLVEGGSSLSLTEAGNYLALSQPFTDSPTVYSSGFFEAGSSGTNQKKTKQRKRPPKYVRKTKPKEEKGAHQSQILQLGLKVGVKEKRKAVEEGYNTAKATKLNPKMMVPNEGPSNV